MMKKCTCGSFWLAFSYQAATFLPHYPQTFGNNDSNDPFILSLKSLGFLNCEKKTHLPEWGSATYDNLTKKKQIG